MLMGTTSKGSLGQRTVGLLTDGDKELIVECWADPSDWESMVLRFREGDKVVKRTSFDLDLGHDTNYSLGITGLFEDEDETAYVIIDVKGTEVTLVTR